MDALPQDHPSRRQLLLGSVAALWAAAAGTAAWRVPVPWSTGRSWPATVPWVPDAAEGRVRLERLASAATGREVSLFTAVPAGLGAGAGLPVVVLLPGTTLAVTDFRSAGMARFVTAAVDRGAAPFVLAGTDGADGADEQGVLQTELPGWLGRRGFDPGRRAVWAWADGGAAALRLCAGDPGWARAGALFSPRLGAPSPEVDLSALAGLPLGVWCALRDIFYEPVRGLVRQLPTPPEVTTWDDDGEPRVHWNDHAIGALAWLAGHLTSSG